ncbi:MAG: glycosyltransferase [Planctomycetota bacterium]
MSSCTPAARVRRSDWTARSPVAASAAAREGELVVTGGVATDDRAWIERCLERARALGVGERVRLVGVLRDDELAALLARAAAAIVPSDSEGFALPALEAAACGLPSVVARGGAAEEAAGPGALPCDTDDAGEVARALERALAYDAAERDALRAFVRTRTWRRAAEGVEQVWRECLDAAVRP